MKKWIVLTLSVLVMSSCAHYRGKSCCCHSHSKKESSCCEGHKHDHSKSVDGDKKEECEHCKDEKTK